MINYYLWRFIISLFGYFCLFGYCFCSWFVVFYHSNIEIEIGIEPKDFYKLLEKQHTYYLQGNKMDVLNYRVIATELNNIVIKNLHMFHLDNDRKDKKQVNVLITRGEKEYFVWFLFVLFLFCVCVCFVLF